MELTIGLTNTLWTICIINPQIDVIKEYFSTCHTPHSTMVANAYIPYFFNQLFSLNIFNKNKKKEEELIID